MSRAYRDNLEKEYDRKEAMKYKGYKKCENCTEMFKPSSSDPTQFICDNCLEKAYEKF